MRAAPPLRVREGGGGAAAEQRGGAGGQEAARPRLAPMGPHVGGKQNQISFVVMPYYSTYLQVKNHNNNLFQINYDLSVERRDG